MTRPTIQFVDKQVTRSEFTKLFEKKVRKAIRMNGITREDKVWCDGEITEYFFDRLKLPCIKATTKEDATLYFLSDTLDDLCDAFLQQILYGKKPKTRPEKGVLLFSTISTEDVARFCTYRDIPFDKNVSELMQRIDSLEKKYPGIKQGLGKFAESLKR